ncbi:MAG TPA: bifunctional phosphoribosylaminoimidazolecarboxamide formyltransferase/IMP cyclohydrolase, partial [Lentimicrobium sp.]|nr:bifunctional phosphoribosylaminoimidazolecarboxamide formyltransferase/IMP cyclohydrolase [Lentimicrobium sp.]
CTTSEADRLRFATYAFAVSSHYDSAIFGYMSGLSGYSEFRSSHRPQRSLRYGENPHQSGEFFGDLGEVFTQLHGKELSYNNLLDLDAAIALIREFDATTFAIIKHNNACGIASRSRLVDAWKAALAGDPLSAFGGVLVTNTLVDEETAAEINKLFFEIILAPGYEKNALELLQTKKNRIILQAKTFDFQDKQYRSLLNGVIRQDKDLKTGRDLQLTTVTKKAPSTAELEDLLFANTVVKHSKSNAIVLVKNGQMLGSGAGQTSRVDALKQAIAKAGEFGFDLKGAVMASDAFFPFSDSVELAHKAGVAAVIQPGGSVRDEDTVNYCNEHGLSMVFTGIRHFKH